MRADGRDRFPVRVAGTWSTLDRDEPYDISIKLTARGMNSDGDNTVLHFELVQWLAEMLVGDNLAIYGHAYDQLAFGSWELIVGTRHRRRRIVWDGKDSSMSVSESNFASSGTPPHWVTIRESSFRECSQAQVFDAVLATAREINAA